MRLATSMISVDESRLSIVDALTTGLCCCGGGSGSILEGDAAGIGGLVSAPRLIMRALLENRCVYMSALYLLATSNISATFLLAVYAHLKLKK